MPPTSPPSTHYRTIRLLILALTAAILALLARPALRTASNLILASAPITSTRPITSSVAGQELKRREEEMSKVYTAKEEKEWNSLADRMDVFHNHFRYEFNRVYTLADGGFHKEGMSLPRFLREAQQLDQHLDMHHKIETYIFPILGKKMPQFKAGGKDSAQHLKSHRQIHDGLDKYSAFLKAALANPSLYNAKELRDILDSFREILFRHLDEEVHDLGAESMKAAGWTLQELRQIPM